MGSLFQIIAQIIMTILGLIIGAVFGIPIERAHYRNLVERESRMRDFPVCDLKKVPACLSADGSRLVTGQVVIGSDYLKTFLSKLRNIFGGEIRSFERCMDRARREALLRATEEARRIGASSVINVRYETSRIGSAQRKGGVPMAEVLCYGTAVFDSSTTGRSTSHTPPWIVQQAGDMIFLPTRQV